MALALLLREVDGPPGAFAPVAGQPGDRAAERGVAMLHDFFEERTARQVLAEHGRADVIYAANTLCHIPYLGEIFRAARTLLGPDGVFVFEDPYLGDIVRLGSFDQIYDEHFFLFSATTIDAAARRWDLAAEVRSRGEQLVAALTELREQGKRVAGYAATAKSATLLNYCGVGPDLVAEVHDTTPTKQGRLTPGTHIPVTAFPGVDGRPDV